MKITVIRDPVIRPDKGEAFTPGRMYVNGLHFGFTCEDEDRHLETVGVKGKVNGRTAIPRGTYGMEVSFSNRFKKELPAVLVVPGFEGIRVHGGNRAEDSLGCILLGQVRTATGIAQCAATVARLIAMMQTAEDKRELCYLEVK
jgi:hypothetical protein